uniref:Nucleolar protein 8-like n=1 Tax=Phallusia mammillata TaxID=59560 RepID=A0A6F9DN41_9ASCI|nr:nucleolar protein 8-like [Phallusia mammillata]
MLKNELLILTILDINALIWSVNLRSMKGPSKKSLSNKIRLESLEEKKALEAKTKLLIKVSLSNLDQSKKTNKHFKFDDNSSDSNEDVQQTNDDGKITKVLRGNLRVVHAGHVGPARTRSRRETAMFCRLAAAVEDILGLDNDYSDDEIQIKHQFEGKQGKKLLEIQSRTGMDARFKMDERFVESNSSSEENEASVDKQMDQTDEKRRNLAILQQVVGVAATAKALKRKSATFVDPDTKRYDPTKEGHAQMEVKQTSDKVEKKKRKKKKKDKPVPVDSSKFYETSTTELKSAFGKSQKEDNKDKTEDHSEQNDEDAQTFSFLKMLGRDPEDDQSSDEDQLPYIHEDLPPKTEKQKLSEKFGKKVFKHDSSDSEVEEDEKMEEEHKLDKGSPQASASTKPSTLFMLSPNDERLLQGPRLFCSGKSMEEIRDEWLECKDVLKADYKKKHRNAAKLLNRDRNRKPGTFDGQ